MVKWKIKDQNLIFNYIKQCFEGNGCPEELGTDNGKEFTNRKLKYFLIDKNTKFIHNQLFNTREQGYIERLHRTSKIKLLCTRLDDINN